MRLLITFAIAALSVSSHAADPAAGREKAAVCSACHGANGISVSADIPNLAGQKEKYVLTQLTSFRDGKRANPLMSAMAGQLSDADMENLAAHFASLPGGAPGASSDVTFDATRVSFPEIDDGTFTQYTTINRSDNNQVRYLYANDVALEAAAKGAELASGAMIVMHVYKAKLDAQNEPVVGSDGFYEKDKLAGYAVMENRSGWGNEYPPELRNGDWSYAFFTPDKTHRAGINEAKCLACHQPLTGQDYMFSSAALKARATQ
ncbi:MAG: cytochrome P460 family protein [Gammaproteobacteria bacterium]